MNVTADHPAPHPVAWKVLSFHSGGTTVRYLPGQEPIVVAQAWVSARALAGQQLGVTELENLVLERADSKWTETT